eukprot:9086252-Pyramimonas_sp.AAC.1
MRHLLHAHCPSWSCLKTQQPTCASQRPSHRSRPDGIGSQSGSTSRSPSPSRTASSQTERPAMTTTSGACASAPTLCRLLGSRVSCT